jgi:hypothetical protein
MVFLIAYVFPELIGDRLHSSLGNFMLYLALAATLFIPLTFLFVYEKPK